MAHPIEILDVAPVPLVPFAPSEGGKGRVTCAEHGEAEDEPGNLTVRCGQTNGDASYVALSPSANKYVRKQHECFSYELVCFFLLPEKCTPLFRIGEP